MIASAGQSAYSLVPAVKSAQRYKGFSVMKSKTTSTPANKKSLLREPKSAGIAQAVPPPGVTASVTIPPNPTPDPAPEPPPRKPLIPTVITAAKKILKAKAKAAPAPAAEPVTAVSAPPPVAPVSVKPAVAPAPAANISPAIKAVAQAKAVEPAKVAEPVKAATVVAPPKPAAAASVAAVPTTPDTEHKTRVTTSTVVRRTYTRRKKIEAPAILSDADESAAPSPTGPGQKFSLGQARATRAPAGAEGELPDAYGTKKLFLTARDPHWLYAHWDLTLQQQHDFNAESSDGHLVLRVYTARIEGHPMYEIHVHPESRHWFIHVERAGNSYCAELGYYSPVGKWMRIAVSSATVTPPDAASPETDVEFATIPFEFPFPKLMHIIEEAVRENLPLVQAIEELRRAGHPDLPRLKPIPAPPAPALSQAYHSESASHGPAPAPANGHGHLHAPMPVVPPITWTPQQEEALARVISIDQSRRIWMGSLEITELIRRRLTQEVSYEASSPLRAFGAPVPAGFAGAGPGAVPAAGDTISSPALPFGVTPPVEKSFWFNVNAELVVYGATEPGAKVTLGGHEIKLRADGSFSYRFALPDGKYDLPAVAISADGSDGRAADLKFSRETDYSGDVGAHPQDPSLKAPQAGNLPANL